MQEYRKFRKSVLSALLIALTAPQAVAQTPTTQDIIEALLTRPHKGDKVIRTRGGLLKRRGLAGVKGIHRTIDIEVSFEFDSAILTAEAAQTLDTLGRALADDRLTRQKIEIVGHTDAKGTVEYNLALSTKRAEAVVTYLIAKFAVDETYLSAKGRGKSELRDPDNPEGRVNRRVEIRNVTPAD